MHFLVHNEKQICLTHRLVNYHKLKITAVLISEILLPSQCRISLLKPAILAEFKHNLEFHFNMACLDYLDLIILQIKQHCILTGSNFLKYPSNSTGPITPYWHHKKVTLY